ncbi:MAG TPA: L-rhamnose isomerase [Phycisphaerae bacterium]|nr:L-rhamnose isomerase [Phycisphaerae bacterium]
MSNASSVEKAYELARQRYAEIGVNTDQAMAALKKIPISLHCWQGDDVGGFESTAGLSGGGIQATGNYPGRARTADELRADLEVAYGMIPGKHRLNLHAIYLEAPKRIERNAIGPEHFANWVSWAKGRLHGMDFNPTYFSHPKAADGFTLSHPDEGIRKFWVEHGIACRKIGESFGRQLGTPCVTNVWIPDGYKDIPVDRKAPRERLCRSLDEIFAEKIDPKYHLDAVEGKLFGIGSESFVVGSHEFYLGYAVSRGVLLTLDAGHFHPTEVISAKLSAVLCFCKEMLLHVSRPVRWDSDHVVILDDELYAIAQEIVRHGYTERIHIGLDYFDASINRVAAWVIGARNMIKALLAALLEPTDQLRRYERSGDFTSRLAMFEELKTMPFAAVWDYYCLQAGVPVGAEWLAKVKDYEAKVLSRR